MSEVTANPAPGPDPVARAAGLDLAPYEVPHPRPFLCDVSIDAGHVSRAVAHVSNVEYIRWLDRAAELHADHLGYDRRHLAERGIMWFVARHEIDYLAEAVPGDDLVIATWVRTMSRVKSWRDTLVLRPADKTVVCRGATLWVLVDLGTRRPTRIDAGMAARFAPLHAREPTRGCTSA